MKLLLLISLTCLCSLQVTLAQGNKNEPPIFNLTLKTLALDKGDFSGIYVQAKPDEEPVLLTFNRYSRSKPVEYEGTYPIVFFKLKKTNNPEVPFLKVPVASYTFPTEHPPKDLLLLFRPNKQKSPRNPNYLVFGMDDSSKAFPPNSVIFFNATSLKFIGVVNKEKSEFPLGPSKPFPLEKPFYAAIAIYKNNTPQVLFENTFTFQKDRRVLMMIHPPQKEGSLRIQCYYVQENMSTPQNFGE